MELHLKFPEKMRGKKKAIAPSALSVDRITDLTMSANSSSKSNDGEEWVTLSDSTQGPLPVLATGGGGGAEDADPQVRLVDPKSECDSPSEDHGHRNQYGRADRAPASSLSPDVKA